MILSNSSTTKSFQVTLWLSYNTSTRFTVKQFLNNIMAPKQQELENNTDKNDEEHDKCKEIVNDFLDAAWKVMTPQMIDHLRCVLIDDLQVPKKDVDKFIQFQRELRRKRICLKKYERTVKIGPRNQWIKEVSKDIADKLASFVVGILLSNRSARTKRITEKVLERLCEVTGEDTDVNSANTRIQRTLVVIADQMATWIDETLIELEQKMEDIVVCESVSRPVTVSQSESESSSESEFERTSDSSILTLSEIREVVSSREEDGSGERIEQVDSKQPEAKKEEKIAKDKERKPSEQKKLKEDKSESEGEQDSEGKSEEDLDEKESEAEEESMKETEEESDGEIDAEEEEEESFQDESDEDLEEEESEGVSEFEEESKEESDEDEETAEDESEELDEEELEEDVDGEEFAFEELEEFEEEPVEESPEAAQRISPVESIEGEELKLPGDVLDLLKEDIARISFLDKNTDRQNAMKEVIDKRLERIAKEKLAQSLSSLVKYDIDETAGIVANWVEKILAAAEELPEIAPIYQRQGSAFEITQGEGSQLQVHKVSSTTVAEKVADVRGLELPIRKKIVPRTMSPMDIKSGKDWADWALGAVNIGEEWGKWLDTTLEEVETHLAKDKSEKRLTEDYDAWSNWRDERAREAQNWRLEKQKIKDEGRIWNKKLDSRPKTKELERPERLNKIHSY